MEQWNETFENNLVYPPWGIQGDYATLDVSSEYAFIGTKSWKTRMPCELHTNARNELLQAATLYGNVQQKELNLEVYTKRFAVYFPSNYQFDTTYTYPGSTLAWSTIAQYHGYDGTDRTQPSLPLYEGDSGKIRMWNNWSDVLDGTGQDQTKLKHHITDDEVLATITKGRWHCFHLEVFWDWRQLANKGRGYIKLYMALDRFPSANDILVNYSGPTGFNDSLGGSYFKFGVYKWNWANSTYVAEAQGAGMTEVVRYYDAFSNVRGTIPLAVDGIGVKGGVSLL